MNSQSIPVGNGDWSYFNHQAHPVSGGSCTSVCAAAPKLPLAALRKISEDAGLHHFAPVGDSVEASGNTYPGGRTCT
ncbi:hypothetical protein ACQPYE_22115 [Actinosynnema sp. CA-299493]